MGSPGERGGVGGQHAVLRRKRVPWSRGDVRR